MSETKRGSFSHLGARVRWFQGGSYRGSATEAGTQPVRQLGVQCRLPPSPRMAAHFCVTSWCVCTFSRFPETFPADLCCHLCLTWSLARDMEFGQSNQDSLPGAGAGLGVRPSLTTWPQQAGQVPERTQRGNWREEWIWVGKHLCNTSIPSGSNWTTVIFAYYSRGN